MNIYFFYFTEEDIDFFDEFLVDFDLENEQINDSLFSNTINNLSLSTPVKRKRVDNRNRLNRNQIQDRSNRVQIRDQSNRTKFMTIQQTWDDDHPCSFCGFIYLKSTPKNSRHLCCMNGNALNDPYPQLKPLPSEFKRIFENYTPHISAQSAYYNNILSIAQTTVENGNQNKYESIGGPHAVKLNGRVIHTIPRNTKDDRRGLSYFTYDCFQKRMDDHVDIINNKIIQKQTNIEKQNNQVLKKDFLKIFYNELAKNNVQVKKVIL